MRRIDDRTVELTHTECAASRAYNNRLDIGLGCALAVAQTQVRFSHIPIDPTFWDYLWSDAGL